MLAAMIDGLRRSGAASSAGAAGTRNGSNLASVLSIMEMCWGDVGLLLSMPRQGLGNSAIVSVADEEQRRRFDGLWGQHGDLRATPGITVERLEHKLGVRSSDTATIRFENCRVRKVNLLGSRCAAR